MATESLSKPTQMACVRIDYCEYLLPAQLAMRLVDIMQSAFQVDKEYGERGYTYTPRPQQPPVEMALVRSEQLRAAAAPMKPAGGQLQIDGEAS